MKEILLTQGFVAQVDDEDFDRVNQFKWCAQKRGQNYYAARAYDAAAVKFFGEFASPNFSL